MSHASARYERPEPESHFRLLVEASPVGIAAGTLDGQLLLANNAYLSLLGFSRAELESGAVNWLGLTPPEYQAADQQAFAQALEHGVSEPYEKEMLTLQGERVPLRVVLIRYQAQQPSVVGYLQDLRPQRAAEALLRGQHAEVERQVQAQTRQLREERAALEAFVSFTEAVDGETEVLRLAEHAIRVLRAHFSDGTAGYYALDEGRWTLRAWSEDLNEAMVAVGQAGLPEDTPLFAELKRTRRPVFEDAWDADQQQIPHTEVYGCVALFPLVTGGQLCGVLSAGLRDQAGWQPRDRALVRAVGQSLTLALERADHVRQLEEERAALAAFTAFTEAVGSELDVLTLVSQAVRLLQETRAVDVSYAERSGELFRSRVWSGNFPPELLRRSQAGDSAQLPHLRQAAEQREALFVDHWDAVAEGVPESAIHRAVAVQPFFRGSEMTAVLIMASPTTERWTERDKAIFRAVGRSLALALERSAQGQLVREQRDALEASNEELEAFTYTVSHDLRTPVRHIKSFNDLLRRALGSAPDSTVTRYLNVVEEAAGRMNTMIDALLNLSRTARQPLLRRPVELGPLVAEAQQALEAEWRGRRVRWQIGQLPRVLGDRETLRLVLINLLSNALKYSQLRDEAVIEVWGEEAPGGWSVSVRDNGVGFDPQYQGRLFGVFQRLHRADEFEGTGVGLATVRRIVQRHGGRVWAQSTPGAGATFSFSLPAQLGTPPGTLPAAQPDPPTPQPPAPDQPSA